MAHRPNHSDLRKTHIKSRIWSGVKTSTAVLRDSVTAFSSIMAVGLIHGGDSALSTDPITFAALAYGLNLVGSWQSNKTPSKMSDARAKLHKFELQRLDAQSNALKALHQHFEEKDTAALPPETVAKTVLLPEESLIDQEDHIRYQILRAQTQLLAYEALQQNPDAAKKQIWKLKMPLGAEIKEGQITKQDLINIWDARKGLYSCYKNGPFKDLLNKDSFANCAFVNVFDNKKTARHWHVSLLAAPAMFALGNYLGQTPETLAHNTILVAAATNLLSIGTRMIGSIDRRRAPVPKKPQKDFTAELTQADSYFQRAHNDLIFAKIQQKLSANRQRKQKQQKLQTT